MNSSVIKITEITLPSDPDPSPKSQLVSKTLDEVLIESSMKSVMRRFAAKAQAAFLLEWEGSRVPCGAVVSGKTVAETAHGIVSDARGRTIGFYERLIESGGPSGQAQKMLVFVN